jgi:hypothetical protein
MALEELVVWRTWNPWSIFWFLFSFFLFILDGIHLLLIDILGGAIMFNAFSLSVGGDMYLCITSAL